MVSLYTKYKSASKRKKQALLSLIVGFAFFSILYAVTRFFSIVLCPIRLIFGVPCIGCGLTRGFVSILKFDFKAAFQYNILSIPLFAGIFGYSVACVVDIIFNKNYVSAIEYGLSRWYMYVLYIFIISASYIINTFH